MERRYGRSKNVLEETNKDLTEWYNGLTDELADVIGVMREIASDPEMDIRRKNLEWAKHYARLLQILAKKFPIQDKYNPFCKIYRDVVGCKDCPIGMTKGYCQFQGSVMDNLYKAVEELNNILKYVELEEYPGEEEIIDG